LDKGVSIPARIGPPTHDHSGASHCK